MKKPTFSKIILITLFFLQFLASYSQNFKPFVKRFDQDIKGDMLLIGNNILNRSTAKNNEKPNDAFNGNNLNSDFNMQFVNIDNGATTGVFNSSSANLVIPNLSAPAPACYKIVYAALYWGAVTKGTDPITNIKFKMPSGGYNDITGTVIHDSGTTLVGTSLPYACFADVTSLVTGTGNPTPEGTYTVANVSSKVGSNGGTGLSAGWSLYIVYEDPKLPAKSITSFDGFSAISATVNLDIPVTGFRTIPTGPVRAKFAFSSLEGDRSISGDYLTVNGSILSAVNNAGVTIRTTNNFFNSSVTYIDPLTNKTENYINRNPASTNTLGYDAGILEINNNGNKIIKNNDVSATIGLRSNQDVYFYYFNAIALEIIAPNIVLTKEVFDNATPPNNIGNANVTLGQQLFYNIGFQNIGNDNAENFTIKDILPININFDPANIIVPNNSGITYVYTAATRTILFTIPKGLVEKNDPRYVIKFKVQVVPECNDLSDACSDKIQNQAFATYEGVDSKIKIDDQLSLATFGNCYLGTPAPTNFLVGVENCIYSKDYQLCGANVLLTAANGYNQYSWSTSPSGTPVIGTTQSITVTQTGTYYVTNTAIAPCRSIKQVVTVSPSGTTVKNPVIPFADQVTKCPDNGKDLPKIFLCGANASRLINTGVTDAISIIWQKLDESSCPASGSDDCANEKVNCKWDNISSGISYTANTSGQFRVVFNYAGGCFNIFYFNVFKNLLNPTATSRDIICSTAGEITVGGVPGSGYEYSLNPTGPYQDSNIFSIPVAGTYTAYIRQKGVVSNPCLFSVPGIDILQRNFTVTEFISQPLCNGEKGAVKLAANDVRGGYYYKISLGGTQVNSLGPIAASDYTFSNLSPGTYDYEVKTDDNCLKTGSFTIRAPEILTASVALTKSLTCTDGLITVKALGGTAPYSYYVNGSASPQFADDIVISTAGVYQVRVVDYNGCVANTSITVNAIAKPVTTVTNTNVKCYGDNSAAINFNATATNGYSLAYSIDNGVTYLASSTFSNLVAGTYSTIVRYSLNGEDCFDTMRTVVITQPAAALTASAGVSELAGCGIAPTPKNYGKVRITNPQGGVAPYTYSFDNQVTYGSSNEAFVAPGTYTLYVKDANGCIFSAPVTLDPEPVAPVIDVATPVDFNCDGTATSTVTINNPGGASYTYDYYLDGTKNTNVPSNVFLNVPPGTHAVRVEYKVGTVPTFSNLLKEDFGIGEDVTSPGMNSAYCFERQVTATQCKSSIQINDGDYSVTARIVSPFGPWVAARDHTSNATVTKGRFLAVNIGGFAGADGVLYSKPIKDIIQNQPVSVSVYAMNLLELVNSQEDPELLFQLVNAAGVVIASQSTNKIPKTFKKTNPDWINYSLTLDPLNNTNLNFVIRSKSIATSGNDVVIDDINVYQLPKSCITSKDFTIVVPTGKAFNAQISGTKNVTCFGLTNGEITIAVQNFGSSFQYSIDDGVNYTTATASPVTITGLAANTYQIKIRPDASSAVACTKSFAQPITAPTAVTASASRILEATCATGATIRATGGGGTPAYQYELRAADGTTVVRAFNNNRDFTNVPAGNYTVFVRDANLCTNPTGFAIAVAAPPALTATLDATTDFCYTTANPATLVVNVVGGTAPFTYKFNGNTPQNSNTFTNVAPGTHTIIVTDSNNCDFTINNIVIAPALTLKLSLLQDLTCIDDASIGNEVITGGNGTPYTYSVSYNGAAATPVTVFPYTTTQAGTYVFTITDTKGCPATSNTITVTPKTTPTHTTVKTDVTCNGFDNGSITVTATGGFTSAYTYVLTGPITVTQTTNQFSGLPAGTYDVKVTDSKGCPSVVTQVIIANPAPIVATATATSFACTATNTKQSATITVAPTGGSGTYTYSYNDGVSYGSNNTLIVNDNGTTQTFKIIVKDSNGCLSLVETVVLAPLNPPTDLAFTNPAITCAATTTTVTVTATNGVGALTFLITGTTSATNPSLFVPATTSGSTATFPNLLPGNYTFRVTDANNCFYTESYTIAPVTPIAVTAVKLSDVACFGNSTGSARFTVTGYSIPSNYTITVTTTPPGLPSALSPTGDVRTLTNLVAGTYTFTVTDNTTGCTDSESITILQPTAGVSITSAAGTPVFCSNDNSQITITASGGTPSYGYAAVPSGATAPTTFGTSNVVTVDTNLGTILSWDVYVRDANGCIAPLRTVNITNNGTPTVTATVTNQCTATGSLFQIEASATGGLAPYTYTINTGVAPSPANTFTVAPGTYTITATDANGCPATTSVTVNQRLSAVAAVTKDITCSLPAAATIRVTISGGLAPFTYRASINAAAYIGGPQAVIGNTFIYTTAGNIGATYTFEITDANGVPCTTITNVVTTIAPATVTATETHVDPTCNGFTDGSIRLNATAGEAPFTYSISGSSGLGSSNVFGGLAAGTYNYIVRDAKGCDATGTIVLDNPPAIVVNVVTNPIQCNTNTPGSFDVNIISGGTAPYTYRLLDNAFTQIATYTETNSAPTPVYSFMNLNFGDYYITVVDANGCEFNSTKIRIETPPFLTQTFLVDSNNCATGVDVEVTTSGGIGPFRYSIFGQPSTETVPLASNVYVFTGLLHGVTYFLQVRDVNNCISIKEFATPPSPSGINIAGTATTNVNCNAASDGTLAFTVQAFDPTVTTINYEVLNALTLLPLPTPINGTLTGVAGGPLTGNITTLPAGNYVLRAMEATGTLCSASFPFTITQPAQPLSAAVSANVNANCNLGALVTVTTTGGTGPYTYAAAVAPATSTAFASGNVLTLDYNLGTVWNITVRDANGCTVDVPVTIALDPSPEIALSVVDKCVAEGAFQILVTEITAGTGAYSISVDGGTFSSIPSLPFTVTGLNSGPHTIIIRDANGCTDSESITIDAPLVTTPAITALPTCADNDGVITISGVGGTGTYTYTITPTAPSVAINNTTGVISGLPAGTYTITMTDTATPTACSTTAVVTLVAPIPVTFTTATTPALCVGDSNGTITVTLAAGNNNPIYTYEIIAGPQTVASQPSNIFTGLLPGTYTVRVNSGRGCSADDANVVVAPATVLTANATFVPNSSCSTSTVITVAASGGTGSVYTYNFNSLGFTTDNTFTVNNGPIAASTTIVVRDANGCTFSLVNVTTPAFNPPTEMDIAGTPIYCVQQGLGDLTSTVTINSVTAGVGPYTYQNITSGTTNTTGLFSGLTPGDYLFQVTDANGCTYQELYTVAPVTNITAAVSATTDVTCFGLNNGTATIAVANFSTTYTATLTAGTGTVAITGNTVTITGMQPGNYTLRVTDDVTGCIADVSVVITQPAALLALSSIATNINCDNDNSTITITATGGTTNYQYAVAKTTDPVPTVFVANNVFVVDTNGGADMAWTVYVTDANGCTTSNLQTIVLDASPSNITVAPYSECPDAVTGTYTFTINTPTGIAPFTYSIGGGFQTSSTFIVNTPGTYDVTVKDANGCPTTATALVVIRQPLILTPTVTAAPSCTDGDGVIAVLPTGGSGNYEYRIDSGVYPMAIPFTGIASGAHTIYVRDTTTSCEASVSVNLPAATAITGFALATTPVTCNGGNDGTITATLDTPAPGINDNPVYLYSLNGGTPQASPLFSGLAAGTYTVNVTSERGCTASETIDVLEPALIVVPAPSVVEFGCTTGNTGNFATITVDPAAITGGTSPYLNYEFIKIGSPDVQVQFGSSNVYTEANLAGGSYRVNVYDSQGCIGTTTAPLVIAPYIALDKVNVTINQAITCTNPENIKVTATTIPAGATVNLEYTLVGVTYDPTTNAPIYGTGVTNSTGIFTGLLVGNYLITVKNLDTNCEVQAAHIVNEPNTFDLKIDTIVDVICFGGFDGSANVTFVDRLITTTPLNGDDAGPFSYTVLDAAGVSVASGNALNAGPITISGLAVGTYTVTATLSQAPSCTVSKNFTISGPNAALDITETHTEITCVTGNNDGTISVTATGGWPGGYEYQLLLNGSEIIAYSTQTEFNGLVAGNYTVNVRDSKGCVDPVNVILVNPTPIAFTVTAGAALSCFGDTTSSITASLPTGGSGGYLYTLIATFANGTVTNNGPQSSNVFTNLGAASYQIKVTDSWSCETTSGAIVIAEPALVTANLVLASANTCGTQATLTLTAAGGTAPYIYSVDPSFATFTAMTGSSVTFPVAVGTYNYYVQDANGCISFISNDIKIEAVPTLLLDVNTQNAVISCKGDSSGVIVAKATGGLGNYVYTLLDGAGNALTFTPTESSPGNFTNLPAGSYLVRVVSVDCVEQSTSPVNITEPAFPLVQANTITNVTCSGEGDGRIVITASGGTGIIKYAISPNLNQFFESNVFDNLKPGTYDYIVQDENGCFLYVTGVLITEPNSITVTTVAGSEMAEVCAGDADGMFSINITGGNSPYSVSIDDKNGTYTAGVFGQTQFDFSNLSGSEHTVYIRDANGCDAEHEVILGEPVLLNPQATINYGCVSNIASNSVTITVEASNDPIDLDYALDGSTTFQSSNVFNNLTPGLHTVEVRHTNGCIKAVVFGILQVEPLTLTLTEGGLNEIVANAAGGGGSYTYALDGSSTGAQSNFIITKSGNYTVVVTDANGCTATATKYFEFIDIKIPNAFTPNGDGTNDTWAPTNTINYKDLTFDVFDRYGRKIGSYREGQFWDGRYNGNELPSGDYWYVIKIKQANDGREFVGHFTLYR